ncbi:MAG: GIY-YIG nuclease family protein [Candidatus Levybacteria bacterium]|nr:GIY-YIG nuclease family protein [Candidatus Levybacteria bacterium]
MPFVYILQSLTNSRYYIGSTTNLSRRLNEHNSGKSGYTNVTKPFKIVFSQKFSSLTQARQMEKKLKSFKSREIIVQIIKDQKIKTAVG